MLTWFTVHHRANTEIDSVRAYELDGQPTFTAFGSSHFKSQSYVIDEPICWATFTGYTINLRITELL